MDNLIMNIFWFLFSKHRHLVYTSFSDGDYFKMIGKLKNHGVSCRTRVTSMDPGGYAGRGGMNQYDIYVKKEDVHLVEQAMNSKF